MVIFRYLEKTNHKVLYHQVISSKQPDLYWPNADFIGDVISISDPKYKKRNHVFINELSDAINSLDPPFNVFVTKFGFRGNSYQKRKILDWVISLVNTSIADLEDETRVYDDGESMIEISISPRTVGSSVKAMGMFELDSEKLKKAIKGRIREKLEKYRKPLIVFTCSGLGHWNLDEDTLEMALYGNLKVIFSQSSLATETKLDRAANGIFYNRKKDGRPANTRLLAVVYADRFQKNEKLFLRFKVYHNPFANPRLPQEFFRNNTQFIVVEDDGRDIRMETINKENITVNVT